MILVLGADEEARSDVSPYPAIAEHGIDGPGIAIDVPRDARNIVAIGIRADR